MYEPSQDPATVPRSSSSYPTARKLHQSHPFVRGSVYLNLYRLRVALQAADHSLHKQTVVSSVYTRQSLCRYANGADDEVLLQVGHEDVDNQTEPAQVDARWMRRLCTLQVFRILWIGIGRDWHDVWRCHVQNLILIGGRL